MNLCLSWLLLCIERVHPKITTFTHPYVVPNLDEFLSSVEHKTIYFLIILVTKQLLVAIDLCMEKKRKKEKHMEVSGYHGYVIFCSREKRNSYSFGTA